MDLQLNIKNLNICQDFITIIWNLKLFSVKIYLLLYNNLLFKKNNSESYFLLLKIIYSFKLSNKKIALSIGFIFFTIFLNKLKSISNIYLKAYLYSEGFNVICSIGSPGEIWQVELNLIPTIIKSHGHSTYKWFYSSCTLVVASSEPSSNIFVV